MALLDDPTIQRILDEVNKAASGGILGLAGNYISEPIETMTSFQNELSSNNNQYYDQDQAPLFYPTPDMFDMNGLTNFDSIPSILPMTTKTTLPSNFDLYTTGLYNTMPQQSYLSPYENYYQMTDLNSKTQILNNNNNNINTNSVRSISSISSTNKDLLLEHHHHHQEYPTISPTISPTIRSSIPNLGLNVRTTPSKIDPIPVNITDSNEIQLTVDDIPQQDINITRSTMNSIVEKEDNSSLPPINHDEIDPQYLGTYYIVLSLFCFLLNSIQKCLDSAGKIFYDPNPQVIQRKGSHSVTYKQNIIVRFLQPPPIPNAGPLIIKEVKWVFFSTFILVKSLFRVFFR